ncbi:MAG TPA: hypothetical protein VJS15_04395, partial [Allosphingosinicella sp.]|nr:hypothetical protein [Allosphingosinicella sp.]
MKVAAASRGIDWTIPLFGAAALASAALLLWAVRDPVFTGAFLAGLVGAGAILALRRPAAAAEPLQPAADDPALLRAALDS